MGFQVSLSLDIPRASAQLSNSRSVPRNSTRTFGECSRCRSSHQIFSWPFPEVRFTEIEYVDSSTQLWGVVFREGEKYDKILAESWKGDMDGILFFVRPSPPSASCDNVERPLTDGPFCSDRRSIHYRRLQISSKEPQ
jgi:hypothetical protein